MNTFDEFLSWEKSTRDIIDFKKSYVDMAGDVLAGLVLSEIVYWYLPGRTGMSKLVITKKGVNWIACPRHEWWERCRLTPRQMDRIFKILAKVNLIEKQIFRFNNSPTIHIRLNQEVFVEQLNAIIADPPVNPFLPNGENVSKSPNGENQFTESVKTLTETTTETTKEKDFTAPSGAVQTAAETVGKTFSEVDHPIEPDETPKKERQPNPWYDAVASVFDLHGGRNGLMVGLLQGKATKNGHKDYNLLEPLTSADDILKFGRWWKANHDGLTMVQAPAKVQSEVMGWQAKGCPDAPSQPKPKPWGGLEPVRPDYGAIS